MKFLFTLLLVALSIHPFTLRAEDAKPAMIGGNFEVEKHPDIAYVEGKDADPRKQKLDLFIPKGQKDFPVLFFIHGGAWTSGDRKIYMQIGNLFAKNGVGTVVISYRLSPKVQHPGHIEDVAKAFAWTHANIGKYGGRNDRIFVCGQSAGGHLTALLATDEKYLKAEKLSLKDIRGAMPISGIYTFPEGFLKNVLGSEQGAAESASPIKHVGGNSPPMLILYADSDIPGCAAMSKAFQDALKKEKVEADLKEIKERNHMSIMFSLMSKVEDPTTQALLEFIAKHSELKLKEMGK